MVTFTKPKTAGDLLVHYESTAANMFPAFLTMPATVDTYDLADPIGYPIDYTVSTRSALILIAAGQANVDGFIVAGPGFAGLAQNAVTKEIYTIVRGTNVVINQDKISTADASTPPVNFTLATITGAAGVADMRFVSTPTTKSTQTE
jgi:hypothetical protein